MNFPFFYDSLEQMSRLEIVLFPSPKKKMKYSDLGTATV